MYFFSFYGPDDILFLESLNVDKLCRAVECVLLY